MYKLCDSKNEGKVGYDDFEKFIQGEGGVAADGTLVQKAKPKRKEKTLGEILIAMQKQQQRTILLNPPYFQASTFMKIPKKVLSSYCST